MDVKETIFEIFKDWKDQVKDDGGFMSYIAANGGYEKEVQNYLAFQLQKKLDSTSELILMERTITNGSKKPPRKKVDIISVDPIASVKEGEAFFKDSDKNPVKINYGIELKHRMYKDSINSNTDLPKQDKDKCFKVGLRELYTISILTDCESCRNANDKIQVKYHNKISYHEETQNRESRLKSIDDKFKNLDSNCRRIVVEYPEFQNAIFYSHIYICGPFLWSKELL